MNSIYKIRKNCALWQVVLVSNGKVQFSSMVKKNCQDWVHNNVRIMEQVTCQ